KRIRPVLLWWGFQLAAGSELTPGSQARTGLAEAAASLELLHAAALIHDDVIDHSDPRRGAPALHRQFESLHASLGYEGDGEAFGVSAAIVIGDICLALSEELFESAQDRLGASVPAQRLRQQMRRDVMVGQFLDVRAEVIPLDDARIGERAWEVLSFKSAKYSVEQPLLLGAALGGADDAQLAALSRFGLPLGQAFQLRDDVLGVVGDPSATGKPAGDDIREGLTAVISVKVGDPQFEGQTKTKLGNSEVKGFVQRVVRDELGHWFESNPAQAKDVVRKALQASQARLAARKAREATRR
ncbi:polyprenyl synthetase family protein, partial [Burkholderia multivorans]|uniref:polyprenyl synthetase family protein n=1 Tax=Burkholderia multivorans TaxID=87883 RepID=UPI000DAE0536